MVGECSYELLHVDAGSGGRGVHAADQFRSACGAGVTCTCL